MMAVERPRNMDLLKDPLRVQIQCFRHLSDPLGTEGLLRVDPHDLSVQAPVVLRTRDVDRQLVGKLGLARRKFTIALCNGLRLQAASQKFVQGLRTGRQLGHGLAAFQDDVARLEAADVDGLPRRDDDLLRHVGADFSGVRDHGGRGDRQPHQVRESGFLQLFRRRRPHAG